MTMVSFPGGLWLPERPQLNEGAPSYNDMLIDAASEKAAFIIQAPRTGNIAKVCFLTGTVTTGAVVDVRLETVSATDGSPTGTLFGTNTNALQAILDSDDNTWFAVSLTASAAVTKGNILAVVIANPAVSFGAINIRMMAKPGVPTFPYSALFTASYSKTENFPVVALEYDDGNYYFIPGAFPVSSIPSVSFDTSTDPDEVGIRFTMDFNARVTGFWHAFSQPQDHTVKLYNPSDTVLLSKAVDSGQTISGGAGFYFSSMFSSTAVLLQGATYRLTILPSLSTPSMAAAILAYPSLAVMSQTSGGQGWSLTQRTDAGSWSNTALQRPLMGIICDQIDAYSGTV